MCKDQGWKGEVQWQWLRQQTCQLLIIFHTKEASINMFYKKGTFTEFWRCVTPVLVQWSFMIQGSIWNIANDFHISESQWPLFNNWYSRYSSLKILG